MEPLLIILIPGILGGLVLSLLIARNRRGTPATFVSKPLEAPSPALINMAHIKVEGLGGLGLVAAVTAVAIADPRIRLAMTGRRWSCRPSACRPPRCDCRRAA